MNSVNRVKIQQGLRLILPDVSLIHATHKEELNLRHLLSTREKTAHLFPPLQSGALISVGKLCSGVFTATFTATNMIVQKQVEVVIEGTCKVAAGMW